MPLQNRVTPWGALEAVPTRYGVACAFGNRGGALHNSRKEIVKQWSSNNTVDLGLGHPSTDGGVGVAPRFALEDGKYLTTSLFGAKFFLDVKLGRTTKGTAIALVDEQAWSTYDIAEWTRNADGTLSPASDAKLCAGVTVLD